MKFLLFQENNKFDFVVMGIIYFILEENLEILKK
jgi:hypothetical protein